MEAKKWTTEQLAAIDLDGTLLVAAAAGSGKTAVLVERLIKRVTHPQYHIGLDRLLVVTFTKAAAGEMAARVQLALETALFKETDPQEVNRLLAQLTLLEQADICNLHSFCLNLIRRYFYLLGLDPAFRVADPNEIVLVRQDILNDLLERHYHSLTPAFERLTLALASDRTDQPLANTVLRLSEFASSQAEPVFWLQNLPAAYQWDDEADFLHSPWGASVYQRLSDELHAVIAFLREAVVLAALSGGPTQYLPILEHEAAELQNLLNQISQISWDELTQAFLAVQFVTLPRTAASQRTAQVKTPGEKFTENLRISDENVKELQTKARKLRDEAKKIFKGLIDEFFVWPLKDQIRRLKQQGEIIQTLAALTIEFETAFTETKRRRNMIDYSDMEHLTLQLLENDGQPTAVAKKLRQQYAEIMVDEYQDTNPIQERLLQLLLQTDERPASFFMVGDIKQSIYRFRMADPTLFLARYKQLPHWKKTASEKYEETAKQGIVIDLSRNFRSRQEIVSGINFIFSQIMTPGVGDIEYDELAALEYGANYPEPVFVRPEERAIELNLIDLSATPRTGESIRQTSEENAPSGFYAENTIPSENTVPLENTLISENGLTEEEILGIRQEARAIAKQINQMIACETRVFDKEIQGYRPVRYSDMVILMRAVYDAADVFNEEFLRAGIPLHAESKSGYFEANEIDIMLSLLKIIDNPHQDIPLAGVLRSVFAGLNGRELGKMRALHPSADYYELITLIVWAARGKNAKNISPIELDEFTKPSPEIEEMQKILSSYRNDWASLLLQGLAVLNEAPELGEKLVFFWKQFQNWRSLSRRIALPDLIWKIYEESGYLNHVGTTLNGSQRQANLRLLYERARQYEATRSRGLFNFLRFLEKFQQQGNDLGNARILKENDNIVRIFTIHGSKGLEFPIVFLAGLGKLFNRRDYLQEKVLLHNRLGVGLPVLDEENHIEYPSIIRQAIRQQLFQESLAEEMRILYVAMTRAKEKLYLYASSKNLNSAMEKWFFSASETGQAFSDPVLRKAKCFLDWIVPSLLRHPKAIWDDRRNQAFPKLKDTERISDCNLPWLDSVWIIHLCAPEASSQADNELLNPVTSEHDGLLQNPALTAGNPPEPTEKDEMNWSDQVEQRLSWEYPYIKEVSKETKVSVSELKRRFHWVLSSPETATELIRPEFSLKRPKFLQDNRQFSPAEQGTILHTVMQHLPFQAWRTLWEYRSSEHQQQMIQDYLMELLHREILTQAQLESVNPHDLSFFLNSPLSKRIFSVLTGGELRREVPFTLSLPTQIGNPVFVQGIIDCILLPDLHTAEIIDYKTDSFPLGYNAEKARNEFENRYALQLSLYALAVERLLQVQVSRCAIYSFSFQREFVIPFNEILVKLQDGYFLSALIGEDNDRLALER